MILVGVVQCCSVLERIRVIGTKLARRRYRYPIIASIIVGAIVIVFFSFIFPLVPAQSAERRLPDMAAATAGQKVLVYSPHPDDETIAVGGYIAQSISDGANVRIVLVTNGNYYHQEAVRYAEFRAATSILGVPSANLVFLGFPDHGLATENRAKLRAALQNQLVLFKPDIVIYPSPYDYNSDHATIGRVMESILANSSSSLEKYEYVVHYKLMYPRPYGWRFDPHAYLLPPTDLLKSDKRWVKFMLSPQIESLKEKALLTYRSQFRSPELDGLLHSSVRLDEVFAVPDLPSSRRNSTDNQSAAASPPGPIGGMAVKSVPTLNR